MSGPYPEDLKVRKTETSTVDDSRQYEQHRAGNPYAETHRGQTGNGRGAGSPPTRGGR